jgi:hypothetical protein
MSLVENKAFRFVKPNEQEKPLYFANDRQVPIELVWSN